MKYACINTPLSRLSSVEAQGERDCGHTIAKTLNVPGVWQIWARDLNWIFHQGSSGWGGVSGGTGICLHPFSLISLVLTALFFSSWNVLEKALLNWLCFKRIVLIYTVWLLNERHVFLFCVGFFIGLHVIRIGVLFLFPNQTSFWEWSPLIFILPMLFFSL